MVAAARPSMTAARRNVAAERSPRSAAARAAPWCAAARGIGTTKIRVAMPRRELQSGGRQEQVQCNAGRRRQHCAQARRPRQHNGRGGRDREQTVIELNGGNVLEPVQHRTAGVRHSRPAPASRPSAERCCRSARHGVPATSPPARMVSATSASRASAARRQLGAEPERRSGSGATADDVERHP